MKIRLVFVAAVARSLVAGTLLVGPMAWSQAIPADAFSAATTSSTEQGNSFAASAQDSGPYSDGTRAIHEGRWSDAITIFTKIASGQGEHADGALYWKAYAENKQGQSSLAFDTCLD